MGLSRALVELAAIARAAEQAASHHRYMAKWTSDPKAAADHRRQAEAAERRAQEAREGASHRIRQGG